MSEDAKSDQESGTQSRKPNLIFQTDDGAYFEVPQERLDEFRLSDERVEQLLRKQQRQAPHLAAAATPFYPWPASSWPVPGAFVRAAPGSFVRATPGSLVRAAPGAFVRAVPGAFVRVVPGGIPGQMPFAMPASFAPSTLGSSPLAAQGGWGLGIPSAFVRAVPSALVRMVPMPFMQHPGVFGPQMSSMAMPMSGGVVRSWMG